MCDRKDNFVCGFKGDERLTPYTFIFQIPMNDSWPPLIKILVCLLSKIWTHDPYNREGIFVGWVWFGFVPIEYGLHVCPIYFDLPIYFTQERVPGYSCVSDNPPPSSLGSSFGDYVMHNDEYEGIMIVISSPISVLCDALEDNGTEEDPEEDPSDGSS